MEVSYIILLSVASTDICTADYCMNGGHCNIQSDFTRRCNCITGWTGIRCQSESLGMLRKVNNTRALKEKKMTTKKLFSLV